MPEKLYVNKNQNPFWTPSVSTSQYDTEGIDNFQIFFGENLYNPAPIETPYNIRINNFDFTIIERALFAALDPIVPIRTALILLYNNIMQSSKIKSLVKTRMELNLYKKFYIGKSKNEINTEATNQLNDRFFREIIKQSILKEFYGYSGIYVNRNKKTNQIITVPKRRLLINPDLQIYTGIPSIPSGVKFRTGEMKDYYCTFLITCN
ncbi:MAG: hypothetical protein ORN58_02955 [Sediminibacterium sp.]|nr:hypothetical protein [Sediminibacterium sp.]